MINVLNYVTANRFYVEMESSPIAYFSECSGLSLEVEYDTYLEGGVNNEQRIMLKHAKFTPVTLRRGVTDDLSVFLGWINDIYRPLPLVKKRRNVNILVFNQAGEPMQCWTLIGAVPITWKAPALQADATTVALEELTLVYEGLNASKTGGGGGNPVTRDGLGFFG